MAHILRGREGPWQMVSRMSFTCRTCLRVYYCLSRYVCGGTGRNRLSSDTHTLQTSDPRLVPRSLGAYDREYLVSRPHASPVRGSVFVLHHEQLWKLKLGDLTNGEPVLKLQVKDKDNRISLIFAGDSFTGDLQTV